MLQTLKIALKISLLIIGSIMLLGGCICVTSNIIFALPNLFQQTIILFLILMGISALVAWLGWKIIRFARRDDAQKSPVK